MKYFIVAGEASGDLHGANLMKQLKEKDAEAEFYFWGGDLMTAQGGTLLKHIKDLAFMGFSEVLKNIRTIFKNIKICKSQILKYQADVVIFIDYPGFNLKIAVFAKANGFKTFYYISPSVWAWKESRVKTIKKYVDEMFVILPFEKAFYQKHNYKVHYLGHPLLDAIDNFNKRKNTNEDFRKQQKLDERPIITLLAGSRKQEISVKLPIMLSLVDDFPEYQFVTGIAPNLSIKWIKELIGNKDVKIVENKTYDLLSISHAALVTSGTATLETALFHVPQVVCYKGNELSFQIAKRIVNVKYISLVNLILDRKSVTELIQGDLTSNNLRKELKLILDTNKREKIENDYQELEQKLGGTGASKRIADIMIQKLT